MFGGGKNNMMQLFMLMNIMNMMSAMKMFGMGNKPPLMIGGNMNNNPMQNLMLTMAMSSMMQRLSNASKEVLGEGQSNARSVGA